MTPWYKNKQHLFFAGLLLLFTGYCIWLIYRTSFHLEGQKFYCLFDDAMISMTYAKRVVQGFGLNWAREGAPVEGYSNPLWTFLMIPVNALPIDDSQKSLPVQLISWLCLFGNVWMMKKLFTDFLSQKAESWAWVFPVVLTAAFYPLTHWAIVGMESGLQALLVTSGIWAAYKVDSTPDQWKPWLLLGGIMAGSLLLRMDMVLFAAAVGIYLLPKVRTHWKQVLVAFLLGAIPFLAYLFFRKAYFGEWWPNTYFLKLQGIDLEVRLAKGFWVFLDFFMPILLPLTALVIGAFFFLKNRKFILPTVIALLYCAYSIYVGGDAWEWSPVGANRFICFSFPLLFLAAGGLAERIPVYLERKNLSPEAIRAAGVGLLLLLLAWTNGLIFHEKPKDKWMQTVGMDPPLHSYEHRDKVEEVLLLNAHLDPEARVAVVWAGIPAYFGHYKPVDILGYNDAQVAHGPTVDRLTPKNFIDFYPGHMKYDYGYTLGKLQPDYIIRLWAGDRKEVKEYMHYLETENIYERAGMGWQKTGSPYVHWDETE